MQEHLWAALVAGLQHGQCALLIGPEIEAEVLPDEPSLPRVVRTTCSDCLAKFLIEDLRAGGKQVAEGSLAAVAQQYEDDLAYGPSPLRAQAASFFLTGPMRPSTTHRLLADLPFTLILSTTHDGLLARALEEKGKAPFVARYNFRGNRLDNTELLVQGSPQSPIIYQLFGDADSPDSLVLSENDLLDLLIAVVSGTAPLPYSLIRALHHATSVLFVGFGIRYWYLRVVLKVLVKALGLTQAIKFVATETLSDLADSDRDQTVLFYQRGGTRIQVCHEITIPEFLSILGAKLNKAGGYKGPTTVLGTRPRVFISYASEDREIAARLYSSLLVEFDPWFDKQDLQGGDLWEQAIVDGLRNTHFVLVIYSSALSRKRDSYVNREIELARKRASEIRGRCLIPLRTEEISQQERIAELQDFQEVPLGTDTYEDDVKKLLSLMRREFQRRAW